MSNRYRIYIVKLNKKVLLSLLVILILLSIIILSNNRALKIFNYKRTKQTIVIDPGHGGIDGGTGDREDILEKDINLDIGIKLKRQLLVEGFNVIMTREKDESLEHLSNMDSSRYRRDLDARKNIINKNKPIAFISIHVNSSRSSSARGVKIYHFTDEEDEGLAKSIAESVDRYLYDEFLKIDMICEILTEDFYILRETDHAGILIEAGFITNPEENQLLKDDLYKERLAFAIKKGILEYLK